MRKIMPGYLPALGTTREAPLTQSGARRGSKWNQQRRSFLRRLESVPAEVRARRACTRPLPTARIISVRVGLNQIARLPEMLLVRLALLRVSLDWCHWISPDRWFRSNTILPWSLFRTCENRPFLANKPRVCNVKINSLTGFAELSV